jgi:hypothetical protein
MRPLRGTYSPGLLLALWLTVKGVDVPQWQERAVESNPRRS